MFLKYPIKLKSIWFDFFWMLIICFLNREVLILCFFDFLSIYMGKTQTFKYQNKFYSHIQNKFWHSTCKLGICRNTSHAWHFGSIVFCHVKLSQRHNKAIIKNVCWLRNILRCLLHSFKQNKEDSVPYHLLLCK